MLRKITEHCKSIGVERTSVWTFAKAGTDKYSSVTRESFLGFGVSATTLLRDTFKVNTFSLKTYKQRIEENALPTSLTLYFTVRQRMAYYLFWCAYSTKIDGEHFCRFFGKPLKKMYGLTLWLCCLLGFAAYNNGAYVLTEKGAYYYHLVEQHYTTVYIDKMWKISGQTAFPDKIIL